MHKDPVRLHASLEHGLSALVQASHRSQVKLVDSRWGIRWVERRRERLERSPMLVVEVQAVLITSQLSQKGSRKLQPRSG